MQPKVTVLVPVYGVEAYLPRCVDSLLAQTLPELEILLLDDGSPDGCPALCDGYAARDARVRVVHKTNEGLGLTRNAGLALARGQYIGFVDGDDYVAPEMFARLYEAALAYDADLVLSGARHVGGTMFAETGPSVCKHTFAAPEVFAGADGLQRLALGIAGALPREAEDSRYGFAVWKNLYRADLLRAHNIRFVSERQYISEDLLFQLDVIRFCRRAVGIPGAFYFYCRNGGSLSKQYRADRFEQSKRLWQEAERRLGDFLPGEVWRPYVDRQLQAAARVAAIQTASSGLPRQTIRRELQALSRDPLLQTVLRRYPYWQLPPMQALFAFTLRYRLTGLQQLLVALRSRL